MQNDKAGGAAFPRPSDGGIGSRQDGMTFLDAAALAALPAIIAATCSGQHIPGGDGSIADCMAHDAYDIAESMVKEKEKRS